MKRLTILFLTLYLLPLAALNAQDNTTNQTVHVVQPGENLYRIALQYGLTTAELAAANNIANTSRILAGQSLVIPGTVVAETIPPATAAQPANPEVEAPVEVIIVPNNEATVPPQPGAENILPAQPGAGDLALSAEATEPIYHTITRGENLRSIAQQYETTEQALIELNGLANPNRILSGQQLLIRYEAVTPVEAPAVAVAQAQNAPVAVPQAEAAPNNEVEPLVHTVQAGEYASAIARRYGINVNLLLAANNLANPDRILVGQQLIIPNGADAAAVEALLYPDPAPVVNQGREIVVDLSNSRVYAYEKGVLMYEAVSSNGLPATPTVQGNFTVRTKVRSQTMSGPGYWLPNVEWVLYFYQGYALHGAYWHNNFGQPMSHGCVNLTNVDAKWFYDFAEVGTPVTVQY